jgi:anaerobic selenocysteine-containing dehydrogenase
VAWSYERKVDLVTKPVSSDHRHMTSTRYATCPLCEANCGLSVELDGDRIHKIRGDADDPLSRGYICPKAVALEDVQNDPDRIRAPLRRRGDAWEEIGWDEALDEAAGRIAAIQREHGDDTAALYVGNPTIHSYGAVLGTQVLQRVLGSRNVYSANSVDGLPRMLVSYLELGSPAVIPIPDLDRTDFLLVVGANPVVSNGSIMTAPDCKRRLLAIRERGGRVVVVDPRRSETARIADDHLFVVPGTDALLLAALVTTAFDQDLVSVGRLAPFVDGCERLPALLGRFTPERVAPLCGIDAAAIRRLARAFFAAPTAVCYGRMGTCVQPFGALATWLVDVLNVLSGNLDRPGGAMFPTPAVDLPAITVRLAAMDGVTGFGRWRSRASGLPEFNGELPVAALADEIETPGAGQIRALVIHAGNPVLSCPNGERLDRAFAGLDFVVAIDLYRNETTRHADLILPPTFGLEHDHYPLVFHGLSVRNTAKYTSAVVPAPPGTRHDWQIHCGLAARLAERRGLAGRATARVLHRWARREGPRGLLRWAVRFGPHGRGLFGRGLTFDDIERAPHGIDLGPLTPRLPELLAGRRIDLAPAPLVADLARLGAQLDEPAADGHRRLLLVGRRHLRSNNSWMHNSPRLVKGPNRCTLLVHPDDAAERGIADGARVRVASKVGAVEAQAEVSDEMMRGVVSLPHGWGHHRHGTGLRVAAAHAGVSMNDLTDEAAIDVVSGTSSLTAVPVDVVAS